MPDADQIAAARRAKDSLRDEFQDRPWFRGVGIVPVSDSLGVRLSVAEEADAANNQLPKERFGVPVTVVVIGSYEPRND